MALRIKQPVAGDWDFDGEWSPDKQGHSIKNQTFSVGIFKWVAKASGKGIKKTAVVKRIRGPVSDPQDVYRRANEYIEKNLHKEKA